MESESKDLVSGSNKKRKVFVYSSEDEDEVDEKRKRKNRVDIVNKKVESADWLGSSDDEGVELKVKEVYGGEKGKQIFELQRKIGPDPRFQMTKHFVNGIFRLYS